MSWQIIQHHGRRTRVAVHRDKRGTWIAHRGQTALISPEGAKHQTKKAQDIVEAPMTGKIISIETSSGAKVEKGTVLIVMEAMKMEYRLKAPKSAQIKTIHCQSGELVDLGKTLVSFK